jgi:hypothetical protein
MSQQIAASAMIGTPRTTAATITGASKTLCHHFIA